MADSDDSPALPAVPSWQQPSAPSTDDDTPDTPATTTTTPAELVADGEGSPRPETDALEIARKFLQDDAVRDAPMERKVAFLRDKGIDDDNINTLLGDDAATPSTVRSLATSYGSQIVSNPRQQTQPTGQDVTPPSSPASESPVPTPPSSTSSSSPSSSPAPSYAISSSQTSDRAPIVTYPEFLAKPARPPPLVTTERLFGAAYAFAGLSTLLYGTSKFVLEPMAASQADARHEFHDTAARKLDAFVAKLERSVSEVPPAAAKKRPAAAVAEGDEEGGGSEAESEADDPTEMFHRDMGTQTSFPLGAAPPLSSSTTAPKPPSGDEAARRQADKLSGLTKGLSGLKDDIRSQSEGIDKIKTLVDVFRDDLDSMTYTGDVLSVDSYGRRKEPEPEDEIRKLRDSIRRIKGVLLSTRNFPVSTR